MCIRDSCWATPADSIAALPRMVQQLKFNRFVQRFFPPIFWKRATNEQRFGIGAVARPLRCSNLAHKLALRVRPISSSRITEFSQHEANGCEAQEDQAAEVEVFPVLGKPAATIEPRNGALDDPSARQNDEAFGPIGTPDDFGFELRSDLGQRRMEDRPRIGAIGKEPFQKRKQAEKRGQQQDAAVAILNIGRMNNRVQQQTLCIYQDMPLLALDELACIKPGRIDSRSPPFSALFTLWLSMMAAVGLVSRPACSRHFS